MFTPRRWYITVSCIVHFPFLFPSPPAPPHPSLVCFGGFPFTVFAQLVASLAGCKVTIGGRIVTLTTTLTADKQRLVTEHLHSPALLHYGLDEQHQQNMATVAPLTGREEAPSADSAYQAMDEKESTGSNAV
jgi:hypothetical protein